MTAAEHQLRVNALVTERQRMQEALEANRILLRDEIQACADALGREHRRPS